MIEKKYHDTPVLRLYFTDWGFLVVDRQFEIVTLRFLIFFVNEQGVKGRENVGFLVWGEIEELEEVREMMATCKDLGWHCDLWGFLFLT